MQRTNVCNVSVGVVEVWGCGGGVWEWVGKDRWAAYRPPLPPPTPMLQRVTGERTLTQQFSWTHVREEILTE